MENLFNLHYILQKIAQTSGKNDKQQLIKDNLSDELFVETMKFLLNSFITTGISAKKYNKNINYDKEIQTSLTLKEMFDYFTKSTSGRDEDIIVLQKFCDDVSLHWNEDIAETMASIIRKDLKLGVSDETWNKVCKESDKVPTFSVMLAKNYVEHMEKVKGIFIITQKLDGCFSGGMRVNMADGSYKKIKDISIGDEVLSFNEETKVVSAKRVTNVFFNGMKPLEEWYIVRIRKGNTRRTIKVTGNHKIFTRDGWKEVRELSQNNKIYTYNYIMSDEQKDVLLGTVLGDTSITINDTKYARFELGRVDKDADVELFNYQKMLFSKFLGGSAKVTSGYGSIMNKANINSMNFLPKYMYNYNNIRKTSYKMTDEILDNITPLSLAMFYLDDGTKRGCRDDGNLGVSNISVRCSFSVYKFPLEEIVKFKEMLYNKFNISCKITKDKKLKDGKISHRIDINSEDTIKFFDLIAKYIPNKMRYKLGTKWRAVEEYDWWNKKGEYGLFEEEIVSIEKMSDNKKDYYNKNISAYDIEVEDNHTYFIEDFAVHNCRCLITKKNGEVKSYTRTGQRYIGIEHIENEIANSDMDDFVFDGEIIADFDGSTLEQYAKTTSMARKESGDKTDLKFYAFDIIPYDTFFNDIEREDLPCYNRKIALANYIDRNKFENVINLPMLYFGDEVEKIEEFEKIAEQNGWEGIMINLNKPYVRKRTDRLLKNKKFKTCDIRIIGFEEGYGRLKGTLGNLICDYKGNNVGVGSGFSDSLRAEIWDNQDKWLNSIIETKFFEESKDSKTGLLSLRFPVFIRDRSDEKNEPSYN